jgi:hypothetical protein
MNVSGNSDSHFVEMCQSKKGQFLSVKKTIVAFLHTRLDGCVTVHHSLCEVLVRVEGKACSACKNYRSRLRAMYSSFIKTHSESPRQFKVS